MSACETLQPPPLHAQTKRDVFLFDIDNTLYRKATGIGDLMQVYIRKYIQAKLHLAPDEAQRLQTEYYREYGLAIEGLVRKNDVDAVEYNAEVDDALPLEQFLRPDPRLRAMLSQIDRTKYKLWLCTNAYRTHGVRVINLLGIADFFEGITYCDYAARPLICKPMPEFFLSTMTDLGISYDGQTPDRNVYFVDDSDQNVLTAEKFGWKAVRVDEPEELHEPEDMHTAPLGKPLHEGAYPQIKYVYQLPEVFPVLFDAQK